MVDFVVVMPSFAKFVTIASLIVIFITIVVYSGFVYFGGFFVTQNESVDRLTFVGRVVNGKKTSFPSVCYPQFYLETENGLVWMIPAEDRRSDWPEMFSIYESKEVKVSGRRLESYSPCMNNLGTDGCGCDNYVIVDTIR